MTFALKPKHYTLENALLWGNFAKHVQKAQKGDFLNRVVHGGIALIELLPVISQIASLCEMLIVNRLRENNAPPLNLKRVKQNTPSSALPIFIRPNVPRQEQANDAPIKTKKNPLINPQFKADLQNNPGISADEKSTLKYGNATIEVAVVENIALLNAEAIVNAANDQLIAGSGVCGDIHAAGGDAIFDECKAYLRSKGINRVQEGEAIITDAGNLGPNKSIIHAVGPVWKDTNNNNPALQKADEKKLYLAYYNSMLRAHEHQHTSIALPAISIGIFHFPIKRAAPIAAKAVKDFLDLYPNTPVNKICFAMWPGPYSLYLNELKNTLGNSPSNASNKVSTIQAPKSVQTSSPSKNPLIQFYQNRGKDSEGRTLSDIWRFTDREKEDKHDFIQWLFPTKRPSAFNKNGPILDDQLIAELKADPVAMENFKKSFDQMLKFYGLFYNKSVKQVRFAPNFDQRKEEWFTSGNHNFLRISRILNSLSLLGLNEEAKAFFNTLTLIRNRNHGICEDSYPLWKNAAKA